MSTLAILEGFSAILDLEMWIWSSKFRYKDFYLGYASSWRDFLKIVNFPSSTCAQSKLPLCKCKALEEIWTLHRGVWVNKNESYRKKFKLKIQKVGRGDQLDTWCAT